jgi:hypothetical protein
MDLHILKSKARKERKEPLSTIPGAASHGRRRARPTPSRGVNRELNMINPKFNLDADER